MAILKIPNENFLNQLHDWQLDILEKFDSKKARFFMLRWHRRARKTTLALNLLIRECAVHENRVYGYIAPTYKQAKNIIWRDPNMLSRYLPMEIVKRKNESELFIEFNNGSILKILGSDDPDSIRGVDLSGVVFDEWALIKKETWEEIIRPIIAQDKDRWAIFIFTPKGKNHAYDYWTNIDKWPDEWYKSLLKASDSHILSQTELDKARREMPISMYQQEFDCSFLADEERTLIPTTNVESLRGLQKSHQDRKIIACDPAMGGDECVIFKMDDMRIVDMKIMHVNNGMLIAAEIVVMMREFGTAYLAIDTIGMGKPIADRVAELGGEVFEINSSKEAQDKVRFYNTRAELWGTLLDLVLARDIDYPADEQTRRDISAIKYTLIDSNGKIQLEPKIKTKTRIGRSPDRGDAFVYGVWGTLMIDKPNVLKRDFNRPTDPTGADNSLYQESLDSLSSPQYQKSDYDA